MTNQAFSYIDIIDIWKIFSWLCYHQFEYKCLCCNLTSIASIKCYNDKIWKLWKLFASAFIDSKCSNYKKQNAWIFLTKQVEPLGPMIWHSWTSLKMALQKKGEREKMMTLLLSWLSNFNFALIISYFIILSHFGIMVPSYSLLFLRSIFFFWYLFVTVKRISFPLAHIKRIDGTIQQIKVTVK